MVAGRGRLDPQQLVSKVNPDSLWMAWLFRSLVGVFAGALTVIVFSWVGDTWAFLIACAITTLAVWRSDGAGVHDLLSELWSRQPTGQSVRVPQGHEISTLPVAALRPGDRICPTDEFRNQRDKYDRQLAERKASAERVNAARQEAYEHRKRLRGNSRSTVLPPSPYLAAPVYPPTIRYREVIATRAEPDSRLRIGLACGQIIEQAPDNDILVLPRAIPVPRRDAEPAGHALEALLAELQRQQHPLPERRLVTMLVNDNHTGLAIRHALRAAVATRLISRRSGFLRLFRRIGRALMYGRTDNWRGEDCDLTLTHLGELWLTAIPVPDDQSTVPPNATVNLTIKHFNVQIGDHNLIQQNFSTTRERELAAIKQLLAAMSANADALRDFTDALRTLQDAVARNQPDTPASRSAVRAILKGSSRDVLMGVLGNVAYDLLLAFSGLG